MAIDRDKLLDGTYDREAQAAGVVPVMSNAERDASRRALLARLEPGQDLWVFAYGSLIWNPQIHCAEQRPCRVHGYRRAFCMWSPYSRGTPEHPGLMLALARGGSCTGIALRIPVERIEEETRVLWAREMFSGIYRPGWVRLRSDRDCFDAITFLANADSRFHGGDLPFEDQVRILATAAGSSGPNFDYLHLLAETLDRHALSDRIMRRLHRQVRAFRHRV